MQNSHFHMLKCILMLFYYNLFLRIFWPWGFEVLKYIFTIYWLQASHLIVMLPGFLCERYSLTQVVKSEVRSRFGANILGTRLLLEMYPLIVKKIILLICLLWLLLPIRLLIGRDIYIILLKIVIIFLILFVSLRSLFLLILLVLLIFRKLIIYQIIILSQQLSLNLLLFRISQVQLTLPRHLILRSLDLFQIRQLLHRCWPSSSSSQQHPLQGRWYDL